jgi:hypothetical protein
MREAAVQTPAEQFIGRRMRTSAGQATGGKQRVQRLHERFPQKQQQKHR